MWWSQCCWISYSIFSTLEERCASAGPCISSWLPRWHPFPSSGHQNFLSSECPEQRISSQLQWSSLVCWFPRCWINCSFILIQWMVFMETNRPKMTSLFTINCWINFHHHKLFRVVSVIPYFSNFCCSSRKRPAMSSMAWNYQQRSTGCMVTSRVDKNYQNQHKSNYLDTSYPYLYLISISHISIHIQYPYLYHIYIGIIWIHFVMSLGRSDRDFKAMPNFHEITKMRYTGAYFCMVTWQWPMTNGWMNNTY